MPDADDRAMRMPAQDGVASKRNGIMVWSEARGWEDHPCKSKEEEAARRAGSHRATREGGLAYATDGEPKTF